MIKIDNYPESRILANTFKLFSLRNLKIPKVREFNFWREEEEDETLACIFPTREISKYVKKARKLLLLHWSYICF